MIFFSKLRIKTVGYLAIVAGSQPILLTKKSITLIIFFSDDLIHKGSNLNIDIISSSVKPHRL
ncbi:unnamed protein product, partial [Vitis vinifera]